MVKETLSSNRDSSIKKRKKSSSTPETGKPEEDVYEKNVTFEEKEAAKHEAKKDIELYFETCEQIRQIIFQMEKLRKENAPDLKTKIEEKTTEIYMLVIVLKKLNRLEKFRTKFCRDALQAKKLETDSTKFYLHNLLYENDYFKKENAKCYQFRSMDEEIDLISEEEFKERCISWASSSDAIKSDQHHLHLARLAFELEQRKQLANQCKELEAEKELVAEQIIEKQKRLEKLSPLLKNFLEAAKPLQDELGMPWAKIGEVHKLAALLPSSLYLLYTKVDSYSQVYDKSITVSILGEEDEAKQLKLDEESQTSTADSDSDQETIEEKQRAKRHRRKSTRIVESQESKQNKLLASHPLYIQIKINLSRDYDATLILNFYYRLRLQIITVKCQVVTSSQLCGISTGEILQPENILRDLFLGDSGQESPNPATCYQLEQMKLGAFATLLDQLGYAYNWAQHVCGLEFLVLKELNKKCAQVTNIELSHSNVEVVMRALKQRFQSRITLATQIEELEKKIIPSVSPDYIVPSKVNSLISMWERITWHEYRELPSTERFIDAQLVTSDDILYRITFTQKQAKMYAMIAIKNTFPENRSLFSVCINWHGIYHSMNSDAIRDIEMAVNSDWPTETNRAFNALLLSAQIRRLAACFDIYLEVVSPDEFPQEKIYFNPTKGRNRRHPYKYLNIRGGVYTQY